MHPSIPKPLLVNRANDSKVFNFTLVNWSDKPDYEWNITPHVCYGKCSVDSSHFRYQCTLQSQKPYPSVPWTDIWVITTPLIPAIFIANAPVSPENLTRL